MTFHTNSNISICYNIVQIKNVQHCIIFILFYQLLIVVIDKTVFDTNPFPNLFPKSFPNPFPKSFSDPFSKSFPNPFPKSFPNLLPIRFPICFLIVNRYAALGAQKGYLLGNPFGYRSQQSTTNMSIHGSYEYEHVIDLTIPGPQPLIEPIGIPCQLTISGQTFYRQDHITLLNLGSHTSQQKVPFFTVQQSYNLIKVLILDVHSYGSFRVPQKFTVMTTEI